MPPGIRLAASRYGLIEWDELNDRLTNGWSIDAGMSWDAVFPFLYVRRISCYKDRIYESSNISFLYLANRVDFIVKKAYFLRLVEVVIWFQINNGIQIILRLLRTSSTEHSKSISVLVRSKFFGPLQHLHHCHNP